MYDRNGIINHRSLILPAISDPGRGVVHRSRISASLISITSFLRGLPLFISARPKSPLRVLCLMAFDTLHRLRTSKPMPTDRLRLLAVCLDFEAAANAAFDSKSSCGNEFRTTRKLLEAAGMTASVTEFTRRLEELETNRPSPGGDHGQFQKVKSYREAVVRLSLGMLAATAFGLRSIEDEIRATQSDAQLNILFRIAMQCQIIDDVLDYSKDAIAGLPSFLTAAASLPQALELTHEAALGYANIQELRHIPETFPLRLAFSAVSDCARLVIALRRTRKSLQSGKLICSVNSAVLRAESIVNEPRDLCQSMRQTITAPTNGDTRNASTPVAVTSTTTRRSSVRLRSDFFQ